MNQISYQFLQEYWWFLVSLLGALLVFLMFVQGGQSLLFTIEKIVLAKPSRGSFTGSQVF